MGEILFRGKRIDNDEWTEGYLSKRRDLDGKLKHCIDFEEKGVMCSSIVIPETVGQFTGLTDKNGKKIFEGDIIKITYNERLTRRLEEEDYESYTKEFCLVEQVVFHKGAFCSKVEIEDIPLYRPLGFDIYVKSILKEFEIIGNIHEIPNFWRCKNERV